MSGVDVQAVENGWTLSLPDGVDAAVVDGSTLASGTVGAFEVADGETAGSVLARWVARCRARIPEEAAVEVPGRDLLADLLRPAVPSGGGVRAVMVTTPSPTEASAIAAGLGDGDVLVLCSPPPAPELTVDAYAVIHRRRGAIVGPAPDAEPDGAVGETVEGSLVEVRAGEPVTAGRRWVLVRR